MNSLTRLAASACPSPISSTAASQMPSLSACHASSCRDFRRYAMASSRRPSASEHGAAAATQGAMTGRVADSRSATASGGARPARPRLRAALRIASGRDEETPLSRARKHHFESVAVPLQTWVARFRCALTSNLAGRRTFTLVRDFDKTLGGCWGRPGAGTARE
jgi:hypothetical protein